MVGETGDLEQTLTMWGDAPASVTVPSGSRDSNIRDDRVEAGAVDERQLRNVERHVTRAVLDRQRLVQVRDGQGIEFAAEREIPVLGRRRR